MKWVDIHDQTGLIARCVLDDGQVTIEAVSDKLKQRLERGVTGQAGFKWGSYKPSDGEDYLNALTSAFSSQAMWAGEIQFGAVPPALASTSK